MPDKKLTDNEIVKALECKPKAELVELCYRLQAENEQITEKFNCQQTVYADLSKIIKEQAKEIKTAKAEAYKECVEKVNNIINEIYNKHIFGSNDLFDEEKDAVINFSDDVTCALDNLVKEMVGENNA